MRAVAIILLVALIGFAVGTGYFEWQRQHSVERGAARATGGDVERGRDAIARYGCVACHDIPGFAGTRAHVGPPLQALALRTYLAGAVENTPEHLIRFLRAPRTVVPQGAMPNVGLSDREARDIAAYLYTLE